VRSVDGDSHQIPTAAVAESHRDLIGAVLSTRFTHLIGVAHVAPRTPIESYRCRCSGPWDQIAIAVDVHVGRIRSGPGEVPLFCFPASAWRPPRQDNPLGVGVGVAVGVGVGVAVGVGVGVASEPTPCSEDRGQP